jgi:PAS domain S-box-containing protein
VAHPLNEVTCLLDALQCGAAIISREGRIVHANPRLAEMAGYSSAELIGRSLEDLYLNERDLQAIRRNLERFDEVMETEFYLPRADGSRLPVIISGRMVKPVPGQPEYRVATIVDISAQKQAYQEVSRLSDTVLDQALALKRYAQQLEQRVEQRTSELRQANLDAMLMLAVASEARDEDTGIHVQRIQRYTRALAEANGSDQDEAEAIAQAAILHDVGKIHIPDAILKKPGPLSSDERRHMQKHTVVGEAILSTRPFFDVARQIARSHHENWDGTGYPDAQSQTDTPLPARIVHLVDVYDALTSPRVYKHAWTVDRAMRNIAENTERMFDPDLVDHFDRLHRTGRLQEIRQEIEATQCIEN